MYMYTGIGWKKTSDIHREQNNNHQVNTREADKVKCNIKSVSHIAEQEIKHAKTSS